MKKALLSTALGALVMSVAFAGGAQAAGTEALPHHQDGLQSVLRENEGRCAEESRRARHDVEAFAGKMDGDNESQVAAIETCIADGAKGILITPSDTKAIVSSVKQARDAGILVIALDTPLEPIDAADATFATDNFQAGKLIGQWALKTLGDKAKDAKIALLDINVSQPTVEVLRDQGFLTGFGIDTVDIHKDGDEKDPRIVGNDVTDGNEEGGRRGDGESAAKGFRQSTSSTRSTSRGGWRLRGAEGVGKEKDVTIVSVDGGCPGVRNVAEGVIGATSQQYPLLMASMGIEAIKAFAGHR